MATASLYGITSETTGLYGNTGSTTVSYFEWFIFQDSATQPATPTGGSWNFNTNVGTPPVGWTSNPPSGVVNQIWLSIAIVSSNTSGTLTWTTPGVLGEPAQGILSGSGAPAVALGSDNTFYMQTNVSPMALWYKTAGVWNQVTGSSVFALAGVNSNITSLAGLTGGISTPTYLQFDTTGTPTTAIGRIGWDTNNGGPQLGMAGGNVSVHIGQETQVYVYNNTGSTISKGQVVYVSGSQGQRLTAALAQANSEATSAGTLGFASENIANNSSGFVITNGTLSNINTTGFTNGQVVFLSASTPGAFTSTAVQAPNHLVVLGYVINGGSGGAGSLYVSINNGWELAELHDVQITSVANNNLLQYDNTIPAWKNVSIPKISQISNTGTLTFPTSTDTLVGKATTDTLTNKTLLASGPNTVEATSGPGSSPFSWRNKIINGGMDIAQRGTSFPALASGSYSLDRYWFGATTSGVVTITQQADAPSNNEFQNSLRIAVTTADTSIATGDQVEIHQRIEGYNARDLIGKTFTLSFWVRSSKTGTHCISLRNTGADRSYVAEYTVLAANTWEQKTVTVSGGLPTAGTWNWTNGLGLIVSWNLMCGSTFQTTAGAWQTGNFLATANQVNVLDTIGNVFAITGVQLEVGSQATPFEHRPYGAELALCQRYYQVLPNFAFSTVSDTANVNVRGFFIPMRATPTMTGTPSSGTGATVVAINLYGYAQSGLHSASVAVTGVTSASEL